MVFEHPALVAINGRVGVRRIASNHTRGFRRNVRPQNVKCPKKCFQRVKFWQIVWFRTWWYYVCCQAVTSCAVLHRRYHIRVLFNCYSSTLWHYAPLKSPVIVVDFSHGPWIQLKYTKIPKLTVSRLFRYIKFTNSARLPGIYVCSFHFRILKTN